MMRHTSPVLGRSIVLIVRCAGNSEFSSLSRREMMAETRSCRPAGEVVPASDGVKKETEHDDRI